MYALYGSPCVFVSVEVGEGGSGVDPLLVLCLPGATSVLTDRECMYLCCDSPCQRLPTHHRGWPVLVHGMYLERRAPGPLSNC